MSLSPRAQVVLTVAGFAVMLTCAAVGRKDLVPPVGPQPSPPAAHYGLHVWSIPHCPACVSLHAELRKPEAVAALARFAVVEEEGGGLQAVSWGLHGYPTLIVTDGADHELGRLVGALSAAAVAAWLDGFR
jgi:hypothetical protein